MTEIFNLTPQVLWFLLSWKISNIKVISNLMHSFPLVSHRTSLIRKFLENSLQQDDCANHAAFNWSDWILSCLNRMTHGQGTFIVSTLRLSWYSLLRRDPQEADPESQVYFLGSICTVISKGMSGKIDKREKSVMAQIALQIYIY